MKSSLLLVWTILVTASEARGSRKVKGLRSAPRTRGPALLRTLQVTNSTDGLPKTPKEVTETAVADPKATKETDPKATKEPTVTEAADTKVKSVKDPVVKEDTKEKSVKSEKSEKSTKEKKVKCKKREDFVDDSDGAATTSQVSPTATPKAAPIPKDVATNADETAVPPPPVMPPTAVPDEDIVGDTVINVDGQVVADEEDDLEWCPDSLLEIKERTVDECAKLRAGVLPTEHDVVEGDIEFELISDDAGAMERVAKVLREQTAIMAAGCSSSQVNTGRRLQVGNDTSDLLSISAVNFEGFQTKDDCLENGGDDCDTVRTSVDIYYEGSRDATEEEEEAMMALVVETIEDQAWEGAFGNFTYIEYLQARLDSSSGGGISDAATGSLAGVGAFLALVAVVVGVVFYKKKDERGGAPQRHGGFV